MRRFLLAGLFLLVASQAFAAGVPAAGCGSTTNWIVGSGAQLDSVGNGCVAGSSLSVGTSSSTGATITMTPATGQFVHIVGITIDNCAGASAVTAAAPIFVTSTNFNGMTFEVGTGVAAGLCQPTAYLNVAPNAIRATASGASTVVLPTFKTNQTVTVNVFWYSAP